jgi:hypothetical protein
MSRKERKETLYLKGYSLRNLAFFARHVKDNSCFNAVQLIHQFHPGAI